ncbi:DUF7133 domain-containing protein [Catenovulum adriaticum]|uniref:PQQ-dependent sugar dehydrogenase n=1 Tax=Catenovulum adriaticum TaxID=2984846 RepID=A0ABY7AW42_9ALTE|nr:PQQ-dependent sugar dehydrogenase [Catenovulum sp. TS8]WAJ72431.1 PQQ-dependent sugar dehydrogenase [Catenovulum sp. TS8]
MFVFSKICKTLVTSLGITTALLSFNATANEKYMPDGYSVETIQTPKDVLFHVTGLDTADNGDVYVVTRLGEVWKLANKQWSKFADGLHEPTGLLIDDDGSVIIAQKPELTRLLDVNQDGTADEYIKIADDWTFHDNYHEFNFGPVKDKQGNYYGTLNLSHGAPKSFSMGTMGSAGGYRGWAYKVTPQGEFSPYAYGLRSPAGIGISPEQELFFTDNQGDWVETSKLHILQENKFYGHPIPLIDHPDYTADKIRSMTPEQLDKMREKPVAWIPHIEVANSPGNPEWDTTEGQFGPFTGQIFIGDQTQSNIFRVILDKVNGSYQGAVINFVGGMQSGNIRTKFDSQGQLWVGQTARGWGAKGGKPFGLQKIVWDGTNPFELLDIKLTQTGFKLNFTQALDPNKVTSDQLAVTQWHYLYSGDYGSPKQDVTSLKIQDIRLSQDRKTLEIDLPLNPDKVIEIDFSGLQSETQRSTSVGKVYYTLNQLLN